MKLISCHIENYGKICNEDFSFDQNVTQFCKENGYGKTTLASFMKAMFYGLPSYRSNSKDFNDRKHFYPFAGGKFGGNITFEINGKIYRIERFFDKKSDTEDSFAAYCNGKPTQEFASGVGKTIFGLDEASFARTVFIDSEVFDFGSTTNINARLNRDAAGMSDDSVLDEAKAKLDKARKRLKADRGGSGEISAQTERIRELEARIKNERQIAATLEEKYKTANALRDLISARSEELQAANTRNLILERWRHADEENARIREKERRLEELEKRYPCGIPEESEISFLRNANARIAAMRGQSQEFIAQDKTARLNQLKEIFAEELPDDEKIRALEAEIREIEDAEREISFARRGRDEEQYRTLAKKFAEARPDQKQLDRLQETVNGYRLADRQIKQLTEVASPPAEQLGRKNTKYVIAAAVAAAVAAAGVACLFFIVTAGAILLTLGTAGLLADGFFYLKSNTVKTAPAQGNPEIAAIKARQDLLEKEIYSFLAPYGYYSADGAAYDYSRFTEDVKLFDKLTAAYGELEERQARNADRRKKTVDFFGRFNVKEDSLSQCLYSLKKSADDYRRLTRESEQAENAAAALKQRRATLEKEICALIEKYRIAADDLSELPDRLTDDRKTYDSLHQEIAAQKAALQIYVKNNNLAHRPTGEEIDTETLSSALRQNQKELLSIESQIAEDENTVENLNDHTGQLEREKDKLEQMKQRYAVYKETLAKIEQAEQNLKDKYVRPIKDGYIRYAELLEKTLGEKITMDQNFNLSYERCGENRSEKYLSAGQRSICALCFRLALIDNIFEKEKPFIIMDDPFVNLDALHMEKTADLLKELAKERQIIYFSCHESRKLG